MPSPRAVVPDAVGKGTRRSLGTESLRRGFAARSSASSSGPPSQPAVQPLAGLQTPGRVQQPVQAICCSGRPAALPDDREGYIGAFGGKENWLEEWTVFGPESSYGTRERDDDGN